MDSVLLAMFDSERSALDARSRLLAAGFPEDAVAMAGGRFPQGAEAGAPTRASQPAEPERDGAVARFLRSLFGSRRETHADDADEPYREAFRRGASGITVRVRSEAELERAEQVLNAAGAFDLDERSEQWRGEGWGGGRRAAAGQADAQTLPVLDELLEVGKRTVSRGAVRVFSHVVEEPAVETVSLREERVHVDRHAADRPATEAEFAAFQEGVFEIREMVEEALVSKTARVVEEVEVRKQITQHEEVVRDTVRRTQVDVARVEPASRGSESKT